MHRGLTGLISGCSSCLVDALCGPSSCRMKVLGCSGRGCFGITCIRIRWSFTASAPFSLFPCRSAWPSPWFHFCCSAIFTTWLTPGTCQAHSTKTTKPKLSVVNRLAYPWPLQNLSASMSVMNKGPRWPLLPLRLVLRVRLTWPQVPSHILAHAIAEVLYFLHLQKPSAPLLPPMAVVVFGVVLH